ncbi:MAG: VCBS repeat-containing protein [Acidobacteria bacterium]|nr:MAG: VCBS repeat-containing protein [Acidobacteriota bacterium]
MKNLLTLLFILVAVPSIKAETKPSSFIVFDQVATHRGDKQLYKNWDFQTRLATNPDAPTDWLAPETPFFDEGLYQFRVEVLRMERPLDSPLHIQFGWWNFPKDPVIRHIASPGIILTDLQPPSPGKPWVYEAVGTVRSLDGQHMYYGKGPNADKKAVDWDWRRAFGPNTAYTLVNPRDNDFDADHDGKITEAEYPDIEVRCIVTIHGPGSPVYESTAAREGGLAPSGGFVRRTIDTMIVAPWLKTVGDLDGDGQPDVVVGGAQAGGLVAYHNEGLHWRRQVVDSVRTFSTDGEVADLNGDGRPDIVAITHHPGAVVWYRATAEGFVTEEVLSETWHDVEVADLDGDGRLDLVGRNQKEWPAGDDNGNRLHLSWQRRDGDRLFWEETHLPCPPGEGLAAADLDRDGDVDLVVNGRWYENLGRRRFAERVYAREADWSHPNTSLAVGDVDGNGRLDIVVSPSELAGGRYKIAWFEAPKNRRQPGWRVHVVVPDVETVCHFVGLADFDGDGQPDVVYAEMTQGADDDEVKVMFNRGKITKAGLADDWQPFLVSVDGSHSMRVFDADGDGRPDLFGANWRANGRDEHVKLWLNRLASRALTLGR